MIHGAVRSDVLPAREEIVDAIVQGCGGIDEDRQRFATAWRQLAMRLTADGDLAQVVPLRDAPAEPRRIRNPRSGRPQDAAPVP